MPVSIDSVIFDELTADPSVSDGQEFYNTTDDEGRVRQNAETFDFVGNDCISVYDTTGGQTYTTTAITVNLDTTFKNTNTSLYSLASDQITVSNAGTYFIAWGCLLEVSTGGDRSITRSWIEKNTTEITGTRSFIYHRNTTAGQGNTVGCIAVDLAASDIIRLRVIRHALNGSGNTPRTRADGSRLTIMRLA